MAAGTLPGPGEKNYRGEDIGPCADACKHIDCAATRRMAATPCDLCGAAIGYGVRFYQQTDDRLRHELCAERDAEVRS